MVTIANLARFNLSALPETERGAVSQVIEMLTNDGSNALGKLNAQQAPGYKDTYVIRTVKGTRIIAELGDNQRDLAVVDVYPAPVAEQPPPPMPKVRIEKSGRPQVRSKTFTSGS